MERPAPEFVQRPELSFVLFPLIPSKDCGQYLLKEKRTHLGTSPVSQQRNKNQTKMAVCNDKHVVSYPYLCLVIEWKLQFSSGIKKNNYFRVCHVPRSMLDMEGTKNIIVNIYIMLMMMRPFAVVIHLIFRTTLSGWYYYCLHFIFRETGTVRSSNAWG